MCTTPVSAGALFDNSCDPTFLRWISFTSFKHAFRTRTGFVAAAVAGAALVGVGSFTSQAWAGNQQIDVTCSQITLDLTGFPAGDRVTVDVKYAGEKLLSRNFSETFHAAIPVPSHTGERDADITVTDHDNGKNSYKLLRTVPVCGDSQPPAPSTPSPADTPHAPDPDAPAGPEHGPTTGSGTDTPADTDHSPSTGSGTGTGTGTDHSPSTGSSTDAPLGTDPSPSNGSSADAPAGTSSNSPSGVPVSDSASPENGSLAETGGSSATPVIAGLAAALLVIGAVLSLVIGKRRTARR